jgi:mono/diheme cytochrome c family protein
MVPTPAQNQHSGATFRGEVLPILIGKCYHCHNDQTRMLANWIDYKQAFADRLEIKRRVWDSWKGRYFKQPMPAGDGPEAVSITEEERRIIKEWVESGAPYGSASSVAAAASKAERITRGKQVFATICMPCHQATGLGIPNQFPPLAGSDFLNADKRRAINILIHGLQGQVVVNGQVFNNSMPQLPLTDEDIANALTYVYNSFGNSGKEVTSSEVAALRSDNVSPSIAGAPSVQSAQPLAPNPFE